MAEDGPKGVVHVLCSLPVQGHNEAKNWRTSAAVLVIRLGKQDAFLFTHRVPDTVKMFSLVLPSSLPLPLLEPRSYQASPGPLRALFSYALSQAPQDPSSGGSARQRSDITIFFCAKGGMRTEGSG